MEFKVNDIVIMEDAHKHDLLPQYYPEKGTLGRVIGIDGYELRVQWSIGSTSRDDIWFIDREYVRKVGSV